jgi:hypothetical protein
MYKTDNSVRVLFAYLGYIEAIYFTETGDTDQPKDYTAIATPSRVNCGQDVAEFIRKVQEAELLEPYFENASTSWSQLGHDFWRTRNRHGAGFWDRGLGEIGEKLTEIAQSFKECYVEQGDDGFLYVI